MSRRQMAWAEIAVGVLLVVVPVFFVAGALALGAAVVGVVLVVMGTRQLRKASGGRPKPPMTPRRSRILKVVGWLLVVPLVAALIFAIFVFASVDPNEETESVERVTAVAFIVLSIPFAIGGRALIRKGRRSTKAGLPESAE